jgi:uncharacterized protein (DUF2062 family)
MDHPPEATAPSRAGVVAWLREHVVAQRSRLMNINDTPHSVAFGTAIGMFFGFTPLFGVKTLLSILVAWLFKSNKVAAAIGVTLHDLILPAMPAILIWEYRMGMWVLHGTMPQHPKLRALRLRDYMQWTSFFTLGQPMLIGSLFFALPSALMIYFVVRALLFRASATLQAKRAKTDAGAAG